MLADAPYAASPTQCPLCLGDAEDAVACCLCFVTYCRPCHRDVLHGYCGRCRRIAPALSHANWASSDALRRLWRCPFCTYEGPVALRAEHLAECDGAEKNQAELGCAGFDRPEGMGAAARALFAFAGEGLESSAAPESPHSTRRRIPRDAIAAGLEPVAIAALRIDEARRAIESAGGVTDFDAWFRLGLAMESFDSPGQTVTVAQMTVDRRQCFTNALTLALDPRLVALDERLEWLCDALWSLARTLRGMELAALRGRYISREDCIIAALAACAGERHELWMALGRGLSNVAVGIRLRERAVALMTLLQPIDVHSSTSTLPVSATAVALAAVLPQYVTRLDCMLHVLRYKPLNAEAYVVIGDTLQPGEVAVVGPQRLNRREAYVLALELTGSSRSAAAAWRGLASTMEPCDIVHVRTKGAQEPRAMLYDDCITMAERVEQELPP